MKPGPVHPQEQSWNWTPPDTLVQFGQDNDIRTFGHTLVWHSQTNPWFFEDATRDVLLARLKNHIHTLVGRYKGKMSGWDVVNEAINDGEDRRRREPARIAVAEDRRPRLPHPGIQVRA